MMHAHTHKQPHAYTHTHKHTHTHSITHTLAVTQRTESEEAALALLVERAGIGAEHSVLDLGCGWGSVSLYIAEHFPRARVTSVSNSAAQRAYIEAAARARGLGNVTAITADVNTFEAGDTSFDRVVSVEMFEHMKNYEVRWAGPACSPPLECVVFRASM